MRLLDRPRDQHRPPLMCLTDALDALGRVADLDSRSDQVPVQRIVGTDGRWWDFDERFRPCRPHLQARRACVRRAMASGRDLPPVRLVQLGELFFVVDGHHRVAAARDLGRVDLPAHVHRIETIAWGEACVRQAHLPAKAGERRFLERVPLPIPMRCELWLDDPASWDRLADEAEAWAARETTADLPDGRDRRALAAAWWHHEVVPVVARRRTAGHGRGQRDVQVYADARTSVESGDVAADGGSRDGRGV